MKFPQGQASSRMTRACASGITLSGFRETGRCVGSGLGVVEAFLDPGEDVVDDGLAFEFAVEFVE